MQILANFDLRYKDLDLLFIMESPKNGSTFKIGPGIREQIDEPTVLSYN